MTIHQVSAFAALESEALALGLDLQRHERQAHPLALRAFELRSRYEVARQLDNVIRPGFKNWFATLTGVPEGSVYYYVELGAALAAKVAEEGHSARDLRAAGAALLDGAPKSEVREALARGHVQDYAAARRGAGLVNIRLALPAKTIWDEQTSRWRALTGLPELEAQVLMVAATKYMTDEDIQALARAGEIES